MLINQISEADLKDGRFSLKGSGDQMYDSDVVFFITVKEDEKNNNATTRTLFCTKDRINGKKWKHIMPEISHNHNVEERIYDDKKLEMVMIK